MQNETLPPPPEQQAELDARAAREMTMIKICMVIGILSLVLLPATAIGLAYWKYKQETAAQKVENPPAQVQTK